MSRAIRQGIFRIGLVGVVFGVTTLTFASTAVAQETKVRLEVPSAETITGTDPFPMDVVVEDVVNLGAFEFNLLYDASVLEFVDVSGGPFLGSSGRPVECLEPRLSPGSVHFLCVTLGPEPAGPDGSGTLATVTLDPVEEGSSALRFQVATVTHPNAEQIAAVAEGASIEFGPAGVSVGPLPASPTPTPISTPASATSPTSTDAGAGGDGGGTNWALWGSVIGAAGVVVVGAAGIAWWSRTRRPA